jgi:hypothetical protein
MAGITTKASESERKEGGLAKARGMEKESRRKPGDSATPTENRYTNTINHRVVHDCIAQWLLCHQFITIELTHVRWQAQSGPGPGGPALRPRDSRGTEPTLRGPRHSKWVDSIARPCAAEPSHSPDQWLARPHATSQTEGVPVSLAAPLQAPFEGSCQPRWLLALLRRLGTWGISAEAVRRRGPPTAANDHISSCYGQGGEQPAGAVLGAKLPGPKKLRAGRQRKTWLLLSQGSAT